MDLHINDAIKDPILAAGIIAAAEEKNGGPLKGIIPHPEEIEVTTTVVDGYETVVIEAEPQDPDAPILIPFSQVDEDSFVPAEGVEFPNTEEIKAAAAEVEQTIAENVVEQTFVPDNEAARKRLSDMVVQLSSSLRLRAADAGITIEDAYSERKQKIQESSDLDETAKRLSLAMLDHAYSAAATQGPVDKNDKQLMGALNMLAHGLIRASDAGNIKAKLGSPRKKNRKNKTVMANRRKNKLAKQTRKKQRKNK